MSEGELFKALMARLTIATSKADLAADTLNENAAHLEGCHSACDVLDDAVGDLKQLLSDLCYFEDRLTAADAPPEPPPTDAPQRLRLVIDNTRNPAPSVPS